jgi:hypothetical protein
MNETQRKVVVIFTLFLGIVLLGVAIYSALQFPSEGVYNSDAHQWLIRPSSYSFSFFDLFRNVRFYFGVVLVGVGLFVHAGRRKEVK